MEEQKTEVAAEWVDTGSLTPWDRNPRKNDAAVKKVRQSIKRFGFGAPLLVRTKDRVVIAGHTRLKAAIQLGLEQVPVRFMDLDPADAKLLALADNRLGEEAEWDEGALSQLLREMREDTSLEDLLSSGFGEDELEALLEDGSGPGIYTAKVESPVYEPKGDRPSERDLYDEDRSSALIDRIDKADLPKYIRAFLMAAAARHTVFRYDRIAEYYAHAEAEVQELMEESALIIVDFDRAIELGFVRLKDDLADAYRSEHDAG